MRKGKNQKLKLLYLIKILSEETNDTHGLSMAQIIEKLGEYGVNAERKTIYLDLNELRHFGYDINRSIVNRQTTYSMGARDFELPELKLLVDSVEAARFITEEKSRALIGKLEQLTSRYDRGYLNRPIYIEGRVKTMNQNIYYNLDDLQRAIRQNRQVRFHYFRWNLQKEPELRRDGAYYEVSPWCLMWNNETYYLAAYERDSDQIKNFRVDKIRDIDVLGEPRLGRAVYEAVDMDKYARGVFSMFSGDLRMVTLYADNDYANVLIDRFGTDIPIVPVNEGHFVTAVEVAVSPMFLGWVMSMGNHLEIVGPEDVREQMRARTAELAARYEQEPSWDPTAGRSAWEAAQLAAAQAAAENRAPEKPQQIRPADEEELTQQPEEETED